MKNGKENIMTCKTKNKFYFINKIINFFFFNFKKDDNQMLCSDLNLINQDQKLEQKAKNLTIIFTNQKKRETTKAEEIQDLKKI